MLPVAELAKLREETIYETPDGGSYSPAISGLPYTVNEPDYHYQSINREELPKMEATQTKEVSIDLEKLNKMMRPSEILLPKEIQSLANENRYAQLLTQKEQENVTLRQQLLLKERYILIYEFALHARIDLSVYDIKDDPQTGEVKFTLKEAKANDSPPSN